MRIAITGGTGFVGRHLARQLLADGHEVVLISRGQDDRDLAIRHEARVTFAPVGLEDAAALTQAFAGCHAVAHCAGINRELGRQTYQQVHVEGTGNVVRAAQRAGVRKITLLSFLRARHDCGSGYHESKFAAERIVRASGLDYTIFKAGIIYGRGDHMLDHLSHAFHTFPIFALVGFEDRALRPTAVEEMARILKAALVEGRLSRRTVGVMGPEAMPLSEAVRRVARACGRRPLTFRMPLWFHYALAWVAERVMRIPLVSLAQVRMLAEGLVEPLPPCELVPEDLAPRLRFTQRQILKGLPEPKPFGPGDFRCVGGWCCKIALCGGYDRR
jgi:NADH dehydrogenase